MKKVLIGVVVVVVIFFMLGSGESTKTSDGIRASISCVKKIITNDPLVSELIEANNGFKFIYKGFISKVTFYQEGELIKKISVNVIGKGYEINQINNASSILFDQILNDCKV